MTPVRGRAICAALGLALSACSTDPGASPAASAPAPSASSVAASPSPAASPSASEEPSVVAPSVAPAATWAQLSATGPAAREDHTWTVDAGGRTAYLFGGRDGATVFGDTWAFDLDAETWTQLSPASNPSARFGHEAAWVDGIGVVIFAGQAGSSFYGDLWAFDPIAATWTQLPARGSPPTPRYGSCAGVGPDGRLWISHGFTQDGVRFSDTRAYDFATEAWSDETPAGPRPVERCLHGCWWTDDGRLTLYAGQTTGTTALADGWTLEDGAWTMAGGALPPGRNLYARARLDDATLVFGGQAVDGAALADLWRLDDDGADAIAIIASTDGPAPSGRWGAEMIRDEAGGRVLLFGGRSVEAAFGDLWSLRLS